MYQGWHLKLLRAWKLGKSESKFKIQFHLKVGKVLRYSWLLQRATGSYLLLLLLGPRRPSRSTAHLQNKQQQ
jgi:hypothetical protein